MSKMPTAMMLQIPQNPCTSEMSNGSSISALTISFLVEVKIIDPIRPITQAAQSSMLDDEEVTDTRPARIALQRCLMLK